MDFIKNFSHLSKADVAEAGGKGASLGEMTKAGIPVPPGFVVLSESFEQFLTANQLHSGIDAVLHRVNYQDIASVEAASKEIRGLILAATMPAEIATSIFKSFDELNTDYVAVRSSATAEDSASAAWAGQLESYLNTTRDHVLDRVQECWSSLFTPRAIFYRHEKDLHEKHVSVAVVVQKMVQSEVSGIAFSVHPVTEDYNQLIIEAAFGLGEAIVSGQITPDSFVVEKEPRRMIEKNITTQSRALVRGGDTGSPSTDSGQTNVWITLTSQEGEKPALYDEQVMELSELIMTIENHYGFPCDIEWAYEVGHFFIVQSRPITTLSKKVLDQSVAVVSEEKGFIGIDAKGYYLNFKAKGPGLYFIELGTIAYDPNQVINIVKDGLVYSFYTKEAERKNAEFAKKKDFFDIVSSSRQEIEKLHRKYQNFELSKSLLSMKEFDDIHQAILDLCSLYKYVNNSYLDTFMTVGSKEQVAKVGEYKNEMQAYLFDLFFSDQSVYKKALRNISANTQVPYDDIEQYYHAELILLVKENKKLDQNIIISRKQSAAITKDDNGRLEFIASEKANKLFGVLYGNSDNQNILKGMTGHSNGQVVSGKVKIIHTDYKNLEKVKKEMAEMEEGQVLVSQITAPELMPAIKKARAIVTDIGGMLSHAAIISRELGIPCVIGTKNASEVLRDGDEVEVDADKGIVTIIARAAGSAVAVPAKTDLTRLFSWDGFIPYLYSDRFVQSYIDLDGIAMSNVAIWLSYMSKPAEMRTRQEGVAMYNDRHRYEQLQQDHQTAYNQTKAAMEKIVASSTAIKADVQVFLDAANTYGRYYRWTEFFYTDVAFEQQQQQPQIAENFKTFEQFKLDGRQKLNDMFFVPGSFFEQVVQKMSVDFNLPASDLLQYAMAEVVALFDGQRVAPAIIAARKQAYVIYAANGRTHSVVGAEAQEVVSRFHQVDYQQTELKGTVASSGKATGKAKVFKINISDYDKLGAVVDSMQPGQVLVAETTEPSIIMACNKAAAIVTNQGGMMSHAAIVSRELHIPCLVGVVNATEIIKDGDEVEVDADKGVVRIIKKI